MDHRSERGSSITRRTTSDVTTFQIQMVITAEIKSNGEIKTISTLDWKDPLYMKRPGTCKCVISVLTVQF